MLVRNLAYFSQISLDPRNTNPGKIKKICVIPQTIIEAALYFQELAHSKNMTIDLLDRVTQYRVEGNPDLLRQLFMNLFDNAVKYGQPGTRVEIRPWVQKSTDTLIVSVKGKSVPIGPAERERIFALGYRSESAKARVASGTGLGLHICRTIIAEVHGGKIDVESSGVDGSNTFLIRFPKYSIG